MSNVLALATLALVFPPLAWATDDVRFFRIGTAATTGTYFQIGGVLASAISKPPGTRDCAHGGSCGVEGLIGVALATQGSIDNVLAIGSRGLESAFVQSDVAGWAFRGEGLPAPPRCRTVGAEEQSRGNIPQLLKDRGPFSTLRLIAALFPEDTQIFVRADSGIKSLKDLKGKRISMGEAGSGTVADARLVLEASGLTECDVRPSYLRLARAAEALQTGEIDAVFITAGPPVPAVAETASLVPLRLLPIDAVALKRLMGKPPYFHPDTIEGGTYPGIDEPVQTVSVTALWIVSAEVDDDLVYALARSLWQDSTRRLLGLTHPAGKRIHIETALAETGVPLHPGAARFYAELGMELPPPAPRAPQ